jgi:hypothetical protein
MLKVEILQGFDESAVKDVVSIIHNSFPTEWPYGHAEEYDGRAVWNKNNVHIILRDDEKRVGYLLAIPHNDAVNELKSDDPLMEHDSTAYYVEALAIVLGYRGKRGLLELLRALREALEKRGIFKISIHARVSNNLSKKIQKNMNILKKRRIDAWKYYNYQEPTDYIEATWPSDK